MELVKEIARNVVLVVFFASVLEMLLPPKSNMGKYIQLIMGLFVIVSILTPALNWLNKDLDIQTLALLEQKNVYKEQKILEKGNAMRQQNETLAVKAAIEQMTKQIEALTRLVPGILGANVEILIDKSFAQTGEIGLVKIRATAEPTAKSSTSEEIQPVIVDLKAETEKTRIQPVERLPELEDRVKETVASFYSLRPEQVEVVIK